MAGAGALDAAAPVVTARCARCARACDRRSCRGRAPVVRVRRFWWISCSLTICWPHAGGEFIGDSLTDAKPFRMLRPLWSCDNMRHSETTRDATHTRSTPHPFLVLPRPQACQWWNILEIARSRLDRAVSLIRVEYTRHYPAGKDIWYNGVLNNFKCGYITQYAAVILRPRVFYVLLEGHSFGSMHPVPIPVDGAALPTGTRFSGTTSTLSVRQHLPHA